MKKTKYRKPEIKVDRVVIRLNSRQRMVGKEFGTVLLAAQTS